LLIPKADFVRRIETVTHPGEFRFPAESAPLWNHTRIAGMSKRDGSPKTSLREALPGTVRKTIAAEIAEELLSLPAAEWQSRLEKMVAEHQDVAGAPR
jgi:hypothetical protein